MASTKRLGYLGPSTAAVAKYCPVAEVRTTVSYQSLIFYDNALVLALEGPLLCAQSMLSCLRMQRHCAVLFNRFLSLALSSSTARPLCKLQWFCGVASARAWT